MITVQIISIEFDDVPEKFCLTFDTICSKCGTRPRSELRGKLLTRMLLTCKDCGDTKTVNIISSITDTAKNIWGFDPSQMKRLSNKIDKYTKKS